jgi:hypothetical protein
MPISSSDLNTFSVFNHSPLYSCLGLFCLIAFVLLGWLKCTFNTFSWFTASKQWKANAKVRTRYEDLFNSRNNFMYHISWAKSRGEMDQARSLMKELDKVDKVCYFFPAVAFLISFCRNWMK